MKKFPSKLLLFGEYTVLKGGQALAVPMPGFEGHWSFGAHEAGRSLGPFLNYLKEGHISLPLHLDRFEQDLSKGLFFDSNIPVGYGLGSSGALCAGVYYRYVANRIEIEDTARQDQLRQQLAELEEFFHGNSSGTDPLICYLQQPLLLGQGKTERVAPKVPEESRYHFFLLDTQQSRRTAPLVERFNSHCARAGFRHMVKQEWLPLSSRATTQYLLGERVALSETMASLSALQYKHLQDWIPEGVRMCWAEGLKHGHYSLKLCGAGGGGFLLGYGLQGASQYLPKKHPCTVLPKT